MRLLFYICLCAFMLTCIARPKGKPKKKAKTDTEGGEGEFKLKVNILTGNHTTNGTCVLCCSRTGGGTPDVLEDDLEKNIQATTVVICIFVPGLFGMYLIFRYFSEFCLKMLTNS